MKLWHHRIRVRIADFFHDRFPHHRAWSYRKGWVFKFGPIKVRTRY